MSATVTQSDIQASLRAAGIRPGDTLLVHSSLKSMGYVEGGADAVIDALLGTLGPDGTLVMPTLAQKDFIHAYRDWSLDRPSDVGFITETFRLRPGSVRSDQATHSVAAQGKLAAWLTRDHGLYGKRIGAFGDTPFAVCSPWQKLYDLNAKVLFLGVTMRSNTCKHLIEYQFVNELLDRVEDDERRAALAKRLRSHGSYNDPDPGVWPFSSGEKTQAALEAEGYLRHAPCGDADFTVCRIAETNDRSRTLYLTAPQDWYTEAMVQWLRDADAASGHPRFTF